MAKGRGKRSKRGAGRGRPTEPGGAARRSTEPERSPSARPSLPAPTARRRRRSWAWAGAALVGALLAIAAACLLARDAPETGDGPAVDPGGGDRGPTTDAPVERLRVRVIRRFPHQSDAFTQGLVWHDGELYESTGGEGHSSLRLVELETGEVLRRRDNDPSLFAEGLALAGDLLYQITWRNGRALVFRRADFAPVREHAYEGEGWGLCHDGTSLVMSDGSDQLVFRDPATFAAQRAVRVSLEGNPVARLNELECAAGAVWANVWQEESIVRIDPRDGRVTAVVDASGLLAAEEREGTDVLNGIAWVPESGHFLITGKYWPWLFEVEFERADPPASR
jgi:glutaminyl-peptide cyclotransferase